jgi:hypothetical protein
MVAVPGLILGIWQILIALEYCVCCHAQALGDNTATLIWTQRRNYPPLFVRNISPAGRELEKTLKIS